ncbi:insulinase family protein [Actinoplanes derwentensis]|uniref:Predicted Zn-dependent peptidase n=1 Tax=Actinoplanes derwentensis TaxID=113562 RepID=A0A1H2CK92_9ACTN|nr:insulinase family protein [Actinoplanes derwentensis]GID82679.1 hypothetical protein Ade03nite_16030 [Actinoplanes derwentensis]SDT70965.1 Predicted Zn-dependent peptidase [Actinoplanes derwentensis]
MITELEIGGIPVLHAPATGPMHAGLVFRVGVVDEPLARRGITHLIEHLALHSIGVADHHYNGATGAEFTYFHTRGAETDVVTFLNGVCAALRDLPMERLPVEKEILRTEENSRSGGAGEALALWRHGASDYGVSAYPEWGLSGISADDLSAWTARFFNRHNAALWIAGPAVPAGLDLGLPDGDRQPAPAASSALPVRPAWFPGPSNVVAWDTVVPRGVAATVFSGVLERVLFRSLRQESGLSYTVQTDYTSRADGTALITALADALPEKQGAVLGAFVDVLAAMRLGLIDEADITAVVNRRADEVTRAADTGGRLPGQVFNLLAGQPVLTSDEEFLAELRAVSRADIAALAAVAVADGLLMAPGRTRADWAGYAEAPSRSDFVVDGQAHPQLGHRSSDEPETTLIIGTDGVSLIRGDEPATVRFDRCAVLLAWPDGARRLIGHDGIQVQVEPTLFDGGPAVTAAIDAAVDPESRVTMPARDPDSIPVPQRTPSLAARVRWGYIRNRRLILISLSALAALAIGVVGVYAVGSVVFGDQGLNVLGGGFFMLLISAVYMGSVVHRFGDLMKD